MVKTLGATFAALLVCAHLADVQGDAYERPLSMFRDYEPAWIGYALFALLIAIGLETIRTAYRLRAEIHVVMYLVITSLLVTVVATPSVDSLHTTCALLAMVIMFVYYAVLLYVADELFWLVMHLLMPSFMMMGSQFESYGIWQKGMILYFLGAVVVHQGALAQWLPKHLRSRPKCVKSVVRRRRVA